MSSTSTASLPRARLSGVEAARGVAALLVVFYHTALHVEGNVGGSILWGIPHFGHAGVDFFFVLSGFIITFVHYKDIGSPGRLGHYVQRRFTRVFPFYWIVLAYYLADTWLFHPLRDPGAARLFSEALLLPLMSPIIVGGSWTLIFEILFYVVFATLILSRRVGVWVIAIWALLVIVGHVTHPLFLAHGPQATLTSPYCLEFFMGMGCAYLMTHRRVPGSAVMLLTGIVLFAAAGIAEVLGILNGFGMTARLIYGPCAALVIVGLVERERSGQLKVPRVLGVLGRASYSVYLVHLVAIGIAFHFISRMVHLTPADALPLWFVLCVVGTGAGVLASIWVEHPVIRLSRRWLKWLDRTAVPAGAA